MTCHAIPSNSYGHFKNSAPSSANQNILEFIKNLSPEEKNQFIENLSQKENENSLKAFAEYISPSGYNRASSLSVDEKKELFKEFAKDLNADQLAQFSLQFSKKSDIQLLSQTIADHSSPEAKIGFIKAIAPESTTRDIGDCETIPEYYGHGYPVNNDHERTQDEHAEAIIKVLSSFENASKEFDVATNSLSPDQLKAVIDASVDFEEHTHFHEIFRINDPKQLNRIIEAATHSDNIDTKTKIFIAATEKLDKLDLVGHRSVTNELTKLFDSDTRGIVRTLYKNEDTANINGEVISKYTEHVMRKDFNTGKETLYRHLSKMMGSDTGKTHEDYFFEKFPDSEGGGLYRNAVDLIYFVGATQKGIDNIINDENKNRDRITDLSIGIIFEKFLKEIPFEGIVEELANEFTKEMLPSSLKKEDLENLCKQLLSDAIPANKDYMNDAYKYGGGNNLFSLLDSVHGKVTKGNLSVDCK